ncbi:tensin-3 [Danaus plexippus plexippus]|uniref:Tensin-3 n=1 Tax=Danaus plexippus plexippus TaxID=278856 RepID=A0A212ESX0_DANPL|nr:tensin-3 [Danaus plexippus plexippus]
MPWNCFWGYESPPPDCRVSGPLHLILKKEGLAQAHAFRNKVFKKPRPCHWCHQPVHNQGSCCRVCKYVCHSGCESKEQHSLMEPHALKYRNVIDTI